MLDLIVDPSIRIWVFLPIVVLTFLSGLIRHYLTVAFFKNSKDNLQNLQENHILLRCQLLKTNHSYIPAGGFIMRRQAFTKQEGYLKEKQQQEECNMFNDPNFLHNTIIDNMKGNLTHVLPTVIIGGWINWVLSGFITTRIPFPLTLPFKSMLQRGIEITELDASWVSSVSWYFLNVFGMRSIFDLFLGDENSANDLEPENVFGKNLMNEQKGVFKQERDSLEIIQHSWLLKDMEINLCE